MQIDFDALLAGSELLVDVDVDRTTDPLELIRARCKRVASAPVETVEAEIARIWSGELRYRNYEVHTLRRTDTELRLDCLTVIDKDIFFVTASITVDL